MSSDSSKLDVIQAHAHFSGSCFNRSWDLIDKSSRTSGEDEQMLLLAMASLWHWTQRSDHTDKHLSVGHWQVSRVYALLGDGRNSRRHAERSLLYSNGVPAFFIAYAHEALARAALVLGDPAEARTHLAQARKLAESVSDADDKRLLMTDLEAIASQLG